jgi:hypothetical protein
MNCKQGVTQEAAMFFDGVFVCPICHTMAESLYKKSNRELNDLLLMLKEGIRIALVEGRLQFRENADGELSKKEVLEAVVRLQEMSDARKLATSNDAVPRAKP